METARTEVAGGRAAPARGRVEYAGYALLAALVAAWSWRALGDAYPWDTGLAYDAGRLAWSTGHPERLATWMSTPFLGAIMALASRVLSVRATADAVVVLGAAAWIGAIAVALRRLRGLLSPAWWWVAAFGLTTFLPMMSTVWFKQFNAIVLVLAAAGFDLVRRRPGSPAAGGALIGLSVAIKPLALLLVPVMLALPRTRRVGAWALAVLVGLNVAAQGFMAVRAHDIAAANPWIGVHNITHKMQPTLVSCLKSNFSPVALMCRLTDGNPFDHWQLQRVAVAALIALLGLWVIEAVRDRGSTSWEVFAFTLPLSAMIGSIQWTHYQIALAPLFLLLLVRFSREGAGLAAWAGLALSFVLASLIFAPYQGWPYGSIFMALHQLFGRPSPRHEPQTVEAFAQHAQYALVLTGVLWYAARRRAPATRAVAA